VIDRFDHLVIGVRDLDGASRLYRDVLGFDVRPGGRHTGRGTHNAIVRFGLDYLELIAVYDEGEAEQSGRGDLVAFLRHHAGGSVGYALATTDIDTEAARMVATGMEVDGPFAMERARPDGTRLSWRLAVPGGAPFRRPWPFFIQWDQSDADRLAREQPGEHPLGVTGVSGLMVLVRDLDRAKDLYERQLGLALETEDTVRQLGARRARFRIRSFTIDLLAPTGGGRAKDDLEALGEGPFQAILRVRDVQYARAFLERSGVTSAPAPDTPGGWLVPPDQAVGARLVLVEAF
jgi:catechol 2,3-dioxygenase-like lactoylglutathione lyase family enzyme